MDKQEIIRRIAIEDARIASADRNIEGLIMQRDKSINEQARLWKMLEDLPPETSEQGGYFHGVVQATLTEGKGK